MSVRGVVENYMKSFQGTPIQSDFRAQMASNGRVVTVAVGAAGSVAPTPKEEKSRIVYILKSQSPRHQYSQASHWIKAPSLCAAQPSWRPRRRRRASAPLGPQRHGRVWEQLAEHPECRLGLLRILERSQLVRSSAP